MISIKSLFSILESLIIWSINICCHTFSDRSISSSNSFFLDSLFHWHSRYSWIYLSISFLIIFQKVISVILQRISLKSGYFVRKYLWYLLIISFFSSWFSIIILSWYFYLLLFCFLISMIFMNRWYSCFLAFFRLITCRNIFQNSSSFFSSFLYVNASIIILFFPFQYSSQNDMSWISKVYQTCYLFVICVFWKYVKFLWSIITMLSIVFPFK